MADSYNLLGQNDTVIISSPIKNTIDIGADSAAAHPFRKSDFFQMARALAKKRRSDTQTYQITLTQDAETLKLENDLAAKGEVKTTVGSDASSEIVEDFQEMVEIAQHLSRSF